MEETTDAAVIRASLTEPSAFGDIFTRHADAVHAYLARRAGRGTADDLAGEVFRVAFEQRRRFDLDRPSARPWLYGIAGNVLRRHHRDGWRRLRAHRRFGLREATEVADEADARAAAVDARRQRVALQAALRALAARDREVLLLHVWEELPYAEIAHALGIPLGTVRSRLHRARRQLRAHLRGGAEDASGGVLGLVTDRPTAS